MRSENPSPDLHPEFIESLRILFDILDTSRTGKIRYENLCARFSELHHPQLPPTFLTCVGKVTPANGLISFDRFITAVKLSLRDTYEINNNTLYRAQSEGRLSQGFDKRRMQAPAMGVNGLDRRTIYGSQPSLSDTRNNQAPNVDRRQHPPTYVPLPISNPLYAPICNYMNVFDAGEPHVAMRPKKANTVRSQKEESRMRHAIPPSNVVPKVPVIRSRPQSTSSYNSLASSGLENVAWRNSSLSTSTSDSQRRYTSCDDETAPRVAKLEGLLKEELELIQKGMETAVKLCDWYKERLDSLDKRKRLLGQGMVALEAAVHEQKLDFLRAHITELNRRMISLMESRERGFPTHINLQKNNLPQANDDQLAWLHRQNLLLNQELGDKTKMLEDLKKEKENASNSTERPVSIQRIQPSRTTAPHHRPSAFVRPAFHYQQMQNVAASPVKVYDTLM